MDSQWKNIRSYFQMIGKRLENVQDVAVRFMWEREIIIVQEAIVISLYGKTTDRMHRTELSLHLSLENKLVPESW